MLDMKALGKRLAKKNAKLGPYHRVADYFGATIFEKALRADPQASDAQHVPQSGTRFHSDRVVETHSEGGQLMTCRSASSDDFKDFVDSGETGASANEDDLVVAFESTHSRRYSGSYSGGQPGIEGNSGSFRSSTSRRLSGKGSDDVFAEVSESLQF